MSFSAAGLRERDERLAGGVGGGSGLVVLRVEDLVIMSDNPLCHI